MVIVVKARLERSMTEAGHTTPTLENACLQLSFHSRNCQIFPPTYLFQVVINECLDSGLDGEFVLLYVLDARSHLFHVAAEVCLWCARRGIRGVRSDLLHRIRRLQGICHWCSATVEQFGGRLDLGRVCISRGES